MALLRRSLKSSLRQLRRLRYQRFKACSDIVSEWFAVRTRIDRHPQSDALWRVHDWLIVPLTLQALDYSGLARHIISVLRRGEEFDADLNLLLALIEEPPAALKIERMRAHEEAVAEGRYDGLAKEPRRYEELETAIREDPLLQKFWTRIKSHYAGQFQPNRRGVMRRTLARERGFDCRHEFKWARKNDRFQITFDALCHRWCLYGFEKESALALKLTANLTPHGTMIFVPRGMSLAANGTLVWGAITSIHKAHGASRQGEKLIEIRMQRRKDREMATKLAVEAKKLALRGKARTDFILTGMGQLKNRVRWLKRLLYDC
ncbi:MAG: hypothetical protein ACOZE5_18255 [Verrucomicrobiota bacterium]